MPKTVVLGEGADGYDSYHNHAQRIRYVLGQICRGTETLGSLGAFIRDSPQSGVNIRFFRPSCKTDTRCRRLPASWAVRTMVEGLMGPFSLAFGRTPPIGYS
jgi:hypothetical protein